MRNSVARGSRGGRLLLPPLATTRSTNPFPSWFPITLGGERVGAAGGTSAGVLAAGRKPGYTAPRRSTTSMTRSMTAATWRSSSALRAARASACRPAASAALSARSLVTTRAPALSASSRSSSGAPIMSHRSIAIAFFLDIFCDCRKVMFRSTANTASMASSAHSIIS